MSRLSSAFERSLPDEAATARLAADLALVLKQGDVVALSGDLGAGKTHFARAFIRALAGDPALEVPSPTYTLAQVYETRPKVTHFDLYRLGDESELDELGFEEAVETGLVLVEWPERAPDTLASASLHIELTDGPAAGGRPISARRRMRPSAWPARWRRGTFSRRPVLPKPTVRRFRATLRPAATRP